MMESFYLSVILRFKHKKWPFKGVLTWFLILCKIQNGHHCWCRHRPPAAPPPIKYTSSCWEDQRLSTKGKIVSKYCNISKTAGRGSFNPPTPPPPPTPLVPRWGYELRVRPRVKTAFIIYLRLRAMRMFQFGKYFKGGPLGIKFLFYTGLSPAKRTFFDAQWIQIVVS